MLRNSPIGQLAVLICTAISFGLFSPARAQTGISLKGKVVNAADQSPIPYATIKVCAGQYGVLSNDRGEFQLYLPQRFQGDSLCISSIGYETGRFSISELSTEMLLTLPIQASEYYLDDVQIIDEEGKLPSAKKLVKRAMRRFLLNYPHDTFRLEGYYRDYMRKDTGYLNLFEAAIGIWDPGFSEKVFENTQVEILQTRYREEVSRNQEVEGEYKRGQKFIPSYNVPSYGGNELSILQAHDPIRNYKIKSFSFVYRMPKDFVPNHRFTLDTIIVQDEVPLYQIGFEYNLKKEPPYSILPKMKQNPVQGTLWIRSDTYAIVRFEYLNRFESNPDRKRYEIIVEYQEVKEKLYLKYISMNNYFSVVDTLGEPFRIVGVRPVAGKNQLILRFNRPPNPNLAEKAYLFQVFFNELQLTVTKSAYEAPHFVRLTISNLEEMLRANKAIWGALDKASLESLLESGTLRIQPNFQFSDTEGSRYGLPPFVGMYQYREFFVNEINTQPQASEMPASAVNKTVPLYEQQNQRDPTFWQTFNVLLNAPLKK